MLETYQALQQGFAKHCERRGGRGVGLRQERGRLVSSAAPKPPLFIGGGEEGAPPLGFPPLGVAASPRLDGEGGQEGERGGRALGWALGPSTPRVSPFPLQATPWALVGGAPAHSGAGPFPLLAHASLRGWWSLPVDPRNPPVVPVHYR